MSLCLQIEEKYEDDQAFGVEMMKRYLQLEL